jgi:glycosyltransferase involved in cell wall biosynthesis
MKIKKRYNQLPEISIVMSVYNAEKQLENSLNSIINQSFGNFEFIIVNDCSTDKTNEILERYSKKDKRIKIFNNKKNLQIAKSLNIAVKKSRAEIVARMDADDISYLNRLKIQLNFLKTHPNVAIVGANMWVIDEKGRIISRREYCTESKKLKKVIFRYSPFAHPAVMFRKNVFLEFGGYDSKLVPCEDIDLWFKIGSKYEFANIPKFLLKYRLVMDSNSHRQLKGLELLGFKIKLKAIKKYGYRPSAVDVIYNFMQFVSLWFMPSSLRLRLYDLLRSNNII